MRKHTKEFKSSISTFGRELDSKITVLGTELILEKEDLFSITPITNSTLLKTVMKEVDFESKKQIGIGQEINVKSGVKVNGEYEYIDYGNYSVYKSEYKAETDTYSHICYDKMLKTMIDYTPLDITYPINLREYITAIATKCGLEFADKNSTFANYNTSINEDHFSNGNYTFRDVLDYIAQLIGGWLCINDNDELEIRYPELAKNYDKVSGENVSFTSNVEDEISTIVVDGKSTQATRSGKNLFDENYYNNPTLYSRDGRYFAYVKLPDSFKTKFYGNMTLKGNSQNLVFAFSTINNGTSNGRMLNNGTLNANIEYDFTNAENVYLVIGNSNDINIATDIPKIFNNYNIMVSKESATSYEPYGVMPSPDYPSEIESVGTYFSLDEETGKYGIEVKNTGKNLFSSSLFDKTGTYALYELKDNTPYTLSLKLKEGKSIPSGLYFGFTVSDYISGSPSPQRINIIQDGSFRGSPNSDGWYVRHIDSNSIYKYVYFHPKNINIEEYFDAMLTESSTLLDYEPYQSSSSLLILDQPLRSLPNGVKDIAYIKNNILYVDRKVGTVVLNGSESWYKDKELTNTVRFYTAPILTNRAKQARPILSNYFITATSVNNINNDDNESAYVLNTTQPAIRINKSIANTLTTFKTWLSTHNTQVDYELAEPYTEEVGEVETLSTFKGVNNVSLDSNVQTNMTIIYPTDYEELDKHFLKDVNVSFTKKYGAINSVVFSRGGGTDNIYRKDNASINKNGLTEIKISDNPFLEGDDRENFIQSLFDKINGLEFYIMDVASTGIMYLELGDLYYFNMIEEKPSLKSGLVKSGTRKSQGSSGGKFLCLLMNNEVKITQGLEESIYTDEPEITETDYKTASITDTSIKNAIIQTNKNSAEILLKVNSDEVVSAINLSPENIKISSAKLDVDAIATFTNSKLAQAGSTVINGANITTGSINCDRLNGGTINGQAIRGGSISITTGNYYFNMGTSTSNPNCSGLNVGSYGVKAHSDITATGFAITDSDTGKSGTFILRHSNGTSVVYLTFTGGILTAYNQLD